MEGGWGEQHHRTIRNWEGPHCTITIKEHSWVRRGIPWDVDDLFTFGLGNMIWATIETRD